MPRKYRQKRRAQQQEETRDRIVKATVELHQEVGPSRTTISAIAERAGVQRLTVYRHFPDESTLFDACSARFLSENPPPDPSRWIEIEGAEQRLRAGLTEIYSYYAETEEMNEMVLRDAPDNPILDEKLEPERQWLKQIVQILADGWLQDGDSSNLVCPAIGHAIDFYTWKSLVRQQGLDQDDAVDLMVRLIAASAMPPTGN